MSMSNAFAYAGKGNLPVMIAVMLSLLWYSGAYGQFGQVTGRVVESETGEPLPGANVFIQLTTLGSSTGLDGRYSIVRVPAGNYVLEASYLGYEAQTKEIAVTDQADLIIDFDLKEETLEMAEVLVLGVRAKNQARALNQQMNAITIKNIVASDQMGRFPDPSVPDAVQRLPGINIERDQGEGRYITIRGGTADMTSVTINGERAPSPEGDERSIAMDAVPVGLLESVEVSKAITPDMDADAIGGSVNLVTKKAPEAGMFTLEGGGGYSSIREDPGGSGTVTYGQRLNDGKFGFLLSGSASRRNFGSDNIEPEYDLGSEGLADDQLGELQVRHYTIWRARLGATGTFDYRFNDNSFIYLSGFYSELQDEEQRRRLKMKAADNEAEFDHKDRREDQTTFNVSAGGEHLFLSGLKLDYHATWTRSEQDRSRDNAMAFQIDTDETTIGYSPDISNKDNIQANPQGSFVTTGPYHFDKIEDETKDSDNTDMVGALNLTFPYQLGGQTSANLKFGAKVRRKEKNRNVNVDEFGLADGDLILGRDIGFDSVLGDFDNFNPGSYDFPDPVTSEEDVKRFVDQNRAALEGEHDFLKDAGAYQVDETTVAGYLMTELNFTPRFMVLPGVRVEHTSVDARGFEVTPDEIVGENKAESDYTKFFPMAHIRYRIATRTNIRAAFTTALVRPNFVDLAPFRAIDDDEMDIGNPDLDPSTSINLDLMFEHYDQAIGIFSAGVFYKDITDPIFEFTGASGFGGQMFDTTEPRNGDSGHIVGVEAALQKQLRFLPGPLDGLGIYANYTYTDSEVNFPIKGELRSTTFPGQADHVLNLAVSYEKGRFSGQLSANYQDDFIDKIAEGPVEDEFVDDHLQLDLAINYRIAGGVSMFLEAVNLTNEPFVVYQGSEARPIQQEYYESWGRVGFRFVR